MMRWGWHDVYYCTPGGATARARPETIEVEDRDESADRDDVEVRDEGAGEDEGEGTVARAGAEDEGEPCVPEPRMRAPPRAPELRTRTSRTRRSRGEEVEAGRPPVDEDEGAAAHVGETRMRAPKSSSLVLVN
jgi:hypothetical protein